MASSDEYFESSDEENEEEEEENVDSEDDCFTVEVESEAERESRDSSDDSDMAAYAGEPLADEEWLKWYEKEEENNRELEKELQGRLRSDWACVP